MDMQLTTDTSTKETTQLIKRNLQALAASLSGEIQPAQAIGIFGQLKNLQDVLKSMHDLTRDRLIDYVKREGVAITENGSLKAKFGEYEIEATVRNTGFDPAKVTSLLLGKGIEVTAGCDADIKYKPNADKLLNLVNSNRISMPELEGCRLEKEYNLKRPVRVENNDG